MASTEIIEQAAVWAAEQYEIRTRALAENELPVSTLIPWAHPAYRVGWHEICHRFDMQVVGPYDRVAFQPLFDREIKRRKLAGVRSGKVKADEWVAKHPK